jgi:hypothetical protein
MVRQMRTSVMARFFQGWATVCVSLSSARVSAEQSLGQRKSGWVRLVWHEWKAAAITVGNAKMLRMQEHLYRWRTVVRQAHDYRLKESASARDLETLDLRKQLSALHASMRLRQQETDDNHRELELRTQQADDRAASLEREKHAVRALARVVREEQAALQANIASQTLREQEDIDSVMRWEGRMALLERKARRLQLAHKQLDKKSAELQRTLLTWPLHNARRRDAGRSDGMTAGSPQPWRPAGTPSKRTK